MKNDSYDLDCALQLSGVDESKSKSLCELLDSKGRTDLYIRKSLAQIFLSGTVLDEQARIIYNEASHIFKKGVDLKSIGKDFDMFKSSISVF